MEIKTENTPKKEDLHLEIVGFSWKDSKDKAKKYVLLFNTLNKERVRFDIVANQEWQRVKIDAETLNQKTEKTPKVILECFANRNFIVKYFMGGDELISHFALALDQFTNEPQEFEFTFTKGTKLKAKGRIRGWYGEYDPPKPPPSEEVTRITMSPEEIKEKVNEKKNPKKLSDCYELDDVLGVGVGGSVHVGFLKSDKSRKKYAIKIITKKNFSKEILNTLKREIGILAKLGKHDHIVTMVEYFEDEKQFALVLEFCGGGDLFERIPPKGFSEPLALDLTVQLLGAIAFCHEMQVVHRDLKPENVLIKDEDENAPLCLKLADFNLSKDLGTGTVGLKTVVGTDCYYSPELVTGELMSDAVDMWGLGVIVYIMLSGFHPIQQQEQRAYFKAIAEADYTFDYPEWEDKSEQCKDFISKLLKADATERMTSKEALAHPWIQSHPSFKNKPKSTPKSVVDDLPPPSYDTAITS